MEEDQRKERVARELQFQTSEHITYVKIGILFTSRLVSSCAKISISPPKSGSFIYYNSWKKKSSNELVLAGKSKQHQSTLNINILLI